MVPAKALADRRPGHVDDLTGGEHADGELGARREIRALTFVETELHERLARRHLGLRVVPGQRLGQARGLALARRRPVPSGSRRSRRPSPG